MDSHGGPSSKHDCVPSPQGILRRRAAAMILAELAANIRWLRQMRLNLADHKKPMHSDPAKDRE